MSDQHRKEMHDMPEERDELKGRLLSLWLDDLKQSKALGLYDEMKSLSKSEIADVMRLARLAGATFYPNSVSSIGLQNHAKRLAKYAFDQRSNQINLNLAAIQKAPRFGDLLKHVVASSGINSSMLGSSLNLPGSTLSDLETGELPPHRLPLDTLTKILMALHLLSKETIDLIRKSSQEWAYRVYGSTSTQLGRVDVGLKGEDRRRVMEDQGDLSKELERIETCCVQLARFLP